jgi:hypothetical protein
MHLNCGAPWRTVTPGRRLPDAQWAIADWESRSREACDAINAEPRGLWGKRATIVRKVIIKAPRA